MNKFKKYLVAIISMLILIFPLSSCASADDSLEKYEPVIEIADVYWDMSADELYAICMENDWRLDVEYDDYVFYYTLNEEVETELGTADYCRFTFIAMSGLYTIEYYYSDTSYDEILENAEGIYGEMEENYVYNITDSDGEIADFVDDFGRVYVPVGAKVSDLEEEYYEMYMDYLAVKASVVNNELYDDERSPSEAYSNNYDNAVNNNENDAIYKLQISETEDIIYVCENASVIKTINSIKG